LNLRSIVELRLYELSLVFLYPLEPSTFLISSSLDSLLQFTSVSPVYLANSGLALSFYYSSVRTHLVRYKLIKFMHFLAHDPGLRHEA